MNGVSTQTRGCEAQHEVDLRHYLRRFESMLQHSLYPDSVDGFVEQRQVVRIGQEVGVRRIVDIEGDQLDLRIGPELVGPEPARGAAHDHHHRPGPASLQQRQEQRGVFRRIAIGPGEAFDHAVGPPTGDRVAVDVIPAAGDEEGSAVDDAPLEIDQHWLAAERGEALAGVGATGRATDQPVVTLYERRATARASQKTKFAGTNALEHADLFGDTLRAPPPSGTVWSPFPVAGKGKFVSAAAGPREQT